MRPSLLSSAVWLAAAGLFTLAATPLQEALSAQQRPEPAATAQGRGAAAGGQRGQAPARDRAPAVGTGHISGSVVLDGSGTPVRRARVNLTGGDLRGSRSIITDDQGSFSFDALPAGRFSLTVSKPGYVTMTYGAKRPGRPGTPIQLAEGQRMERVAIALPRGGVITGVVVDENGEPSPGTVVRALRFVMQTGEKTLQQAGQDQTDDRGMYRIFQLQPGEYLVSAAPRNMNLGDIRQALSAQIQALGVQVSDENLTDALGGRGGGRGLGLGLGRAQGGGGGRGGRGAAMLEQLQSQLAMVEDEQALTYAPIYYPGTASPSAAVPVALGVGEERPGVDFQLQMVPTAHVSGTVVSPAGGLPQGTQVALVPHDRAGVPNIPGQGNNLARVDQEGRFTFQNVTPGQYTLQARGVIRDPTQESAATTGRGRGGRGRGQAPIAEVLWAAEDLTLSGQDVSDLVLTLQPGMTVAGRIVFDGISLPPPVDLQRARVTLVPRGTQPMQPGQIPPADVDSTGQFTIRGVVPGRYALTASIPAGARGGQTPATAGAGNGGNAWRLKSVMIGGRDVLDFPLEIGPNQNVTGASVIFTDRAQSLTGTIQDVAGRPTSDFTIIVFPADNQYWTPLSRRIASSRPSTDGKFSFASLPAGEYRLTAVTDVEPGEWYDPAFLSQLQPVSIPVTVGEGERKVQDIRLAGGG